MAKRTCSQRLAPLQLALGVSIAAACSDRDVTRALNVEQTSVPSVPNDPGPSDLGPLGSGGAGSDPMRPGAEGGMPPGDPGDPVVVDKTPDAGGPRADAGPEECILAAVTAELPPDAGVIGAADCLLEAEWSILQVDGPPGCLALSSAFEARWFRWQGGQLASLDPGAAPFAARAATLERLRFCPRPVEALSELWRFEETFELGGPLPVSTCPSQPFHARYEYTENGEVAGTALVFGTAREAACRFEACVRFVPRAAGTPATPPGPSELDCYGSGPFDPTSTAPLGGYCIADECVAGSFCSFELPNGTCAPLGESTCQEAPQLETCAIAAEPVCSCYRTTPLTGTNRCRERALGRSTRTCP